MGILRFFLAVSVIVAHSSPILGIGFVPGDVAVEAFFIISGFYMSLVLSEKYFLIRSYYNVFLTNRFLRLYPIYYTVLLLSLVYFLLLGLKTSNYGQLSSFMDNWNHLKASTIAYLICVQLTLIGQDTILFLRSTADGGMEFCKNFFLSKYPLFKFMLVPQAWTLSLELMFYSICPFFIKMRLRYLLCIIFFLVLVKLVSVACGLTNDPWTYRFFPFELMFFLSGIVAYALYKRLAVIAIKRYVFILVLAYMVLFTLFYKQLPGQQSLNLIYLASVFLTIPFLFIYTRKSGLDRKIGELSYPVYISHILVINGTDLLIRKLRVPFAYRSDIALVLTVILSIALIKLVGERFDNLRHKKIHLEPKKKPLPVRF